MNDASCILLYNRQMATKYDKSDILSQPTVYKLLDINRKSDK